MLDCSRGLNAKPQPSVACTGTLSQLLEEAERAVDEEFAQQNEVIRALREQRARALAQVPVGAFRQEPSGSSGTPSGVDHARATECYRGANEYYRATKGSTTVTSTQSPHLCRRSYEGDAALFQRKFAPHTQTAPAGTSTMIFVFVWLEFALAIQRFFIVGTLPLHGHTFHISNGGAGSMTA